MERNFEAIQQIYNDFVEEGRRFLTDTSATRVFQFDMAEYTEFQQHALRLIVAREARRIYQKEE